VGGRPRGYPETPRCLTLIRTCRVGLVGMLGHAESYLIDVATFPFKRVCT
jgi:hypothetical protein